MSSPSKVRQRKLTYTGAAFYNYQKHSTPIARLGASQVISVHRFLYMLYRRPTLPVSQLRKNLCSDYRCVNPWHWEAGEVAEGLGLKSRKKWPDNSLFADLLEYLRGDKAEDQLSEITRGNRTREFEVEHKERLKKTHVLIELADFARMQHAKVTGGVFESHDYSKAHWLVDRMNGEKWVGATEWYDCLADYKIRMRSFLGGKEEQISDDLCKGLQWFNENLPIWSHQDEYWIGRNDIESAEGLIEDVFRNRKDVKVQVTCSDVIREMKKTGVHFRLFLLYLSRIRKSYLNDVDWTM